MLFLFENRTHIENTKLEEEEEEEYRAADCRNVAAMGDLFAWLFNLFLLLFLIPILAYQADYINLFDSTSRINRVVMLEFTAQAIFCIVHLLARHWFMFLVSLPCLCFNFRLYIRKEHLADMTEIYNQIGWEKRQRFLKMVYFITLLFISLIWMIWIVGALEKNWDS